MVYVRALMLALGLVCGFICILTVIPILWISQTFVFAMIVRTAGYFRTAPFDDCG